MFPLMSREEADTHKFPPTASLKDPSDGWGWKLFVCVSKISCSSSFKLQACSLRHESRTWNGPGLEVPSLHSESLKISFDLMHLKSLHWYYCSSYSQVCLLTLDQACEIVFFWLNQQLMQPKVALRAVTPLQKLPFWVSSSSFRCCCQFVA